MVNKNNDKLFGYFLLFLNIVVIILIADVRGSILENHKNIVENQAHLLNTYMELTNTTAEIDNVWKTGIWIVQFNTTSNQYEAITNPNPSIWDRINYATKI